MSTLNDVFQYWGNDLSAAAGGDLLPATAIDRSNQRILRRLLTNPGDYIWHPDYGAGLPSFVGSTASKDEIAAVIRGQMLMEASVSPSPAPVIKITQNGTSFTAQITYTEASTGQPAVLTVPVGQ